MNFYDETNCCYETADEGVLKPERGVCWCGHKCVLCLFYESVLKDIRRAERKWRSCSNSENTSGLYSLVLQIILQRPVFDVFHLVGRAEIDASEWTACFLVVERKMQRPLMFDGDLQFEVL